MLKPRLLLLALVLMCVFEARVWAGGRVELYPNGELAFTLLRHQEPFSQLNLQTLQWKGHPALELKGRLHASHWSANTLQLLYSKTLFLSEPGQELKLSQKAPAQTMYITMGGASGNQQELKLHYSLLRNLKDGRFLKHDGTSEPKDLPILNDLSAVDTMTPWASANFPAIWIPKQEHHPKNTLCIFSPDFEQCQFFETEVENFELHSFSETPSGLYLLPPSGLEALFWDGQNLSVASLPKPEQEGAIWSHLAEHDGRFSHGLLKGKEGVYLKSANGLELIGGQQQAKRDNYERPLWQQALLFLITMGSFLIILKWRQVSRPNGSQESAQYVPASVFIRCIAFLIDSFILLTPIQILYDVLGLPPIPLDQFQQLSQTENAQAQMQLLLSLSQVTPHLLMVMLGVATVYHVLTEIFFGGSLGKLFFRLEVISTAQGEPSKVSFGQSFVKALLRSLDFILPIPPSLIFAVLHPENKSLADRIAKVQVVKRS